MTTYCICGCSEHLHRADTDTLCLYAQLCLCVGFAARGDDSATLNVHQTINHDDRPGGEQE